MTTEGFRPAARMAAGVKRTPSVSSATGSSRKKLMMVMHENRLMLSRLPCEVQRHCHRVAEGCAQLEFPVFLMGCGERAEGHQKHMLGHADKLRRL